LGGGSQGLDRGGTQQERGVTSEKKSDYLQAQRTSDNRVADLSFASPRIHHVPGDRQRSAEGRTNGWPVNSTITLTMDPLTRIWAFLI